jgi:hypothetical protein
MDNFFKKKSAESDECNSSNINIIINHILFTLFIFIVKQFIRAEKENSRLTLRKNNLYNILSSKRKINLSYESESNLSEEYIIDINDFIIPEEQKIDLDKFYQNVTIYFKYNILFYHYS